MEFGSTRLDVGRKLSGSGAEIEDPFPKFDSRSATTCPVPGGGATARGPRKFEIAPSSRSHRSGLGSRRGRKMYAGIVVSGKPRTVHNQPEARGPKCPGSRMW